MTRKPGATVDDNGVHFSVWAPKATTIDVVVTTDAGTSQYRLVRDSEGVYSSFVAELQPGARYRYRVDGGDDFPDPRSAFQPEGVHGPSEVIDHSRFAWSDHRWTGISADNLIIYELHVGTYSAQGTFVALQAELEAIKSLGVTAIEIMPVAEFPGRWNWGYDGVFWFAPSHNYGEPDDLRRLVDSAHRLGLAVILDVVYNHFGPDGNYTGVYSDAYLTKRHHTPWGEAVNYDQPGSSFVREFVLDNVRQWIRDYHIDGLRLDASDTIIDESEPHILVEIGRAAREATDRKVVIIAEEARNDVRTIQGEARGGFGIDAVWADDFHHELRVYLSNAREHYFADYEGAIANLARAINGGFIYQGEISSLSGTPRGTAVTNEPASSFVFCIQNHDQIGNRPFGDRIHHEIESGRYAVASALLLLSPQTPMLFMGQEFAAATPFLYFTDHERELGVAVTEGRRAEFGGFRIFQHPELREYIPDPQAEQTFTDSKLRLHERLSQATVLNLYRALIFLRKSDVVLHKNDRARTKATAHGVHALTVHRWDGSEHRLLIANFGAVQIIVLDDPVLRPLKWQAIFATNAPEFGGNGEVVQYIDTEKGPAVRIPARTAVLLSANST